MPTYEDAQEACDTGIEVDGSVVLHGLSSISVAVKPPLPTSRPENLAIDIICALDSTGSMAGSGEAGLKQTLRNFDILVEKSLKKTYGHTDDGCKKEPSVKIDDGWIKGLLDDDDEDENDSEASGAEEKKVMAAADPAFKDEDGGNDECIENSKAVVRRSTSVHFFKFGQTARPALNSHRGFLALDDPELQSTCKAIASDMTFDDNGTNIGCAVEYAASAAKERLQSMAADDAANGTKRITCFVLLTDGSVNEGARSAEDMLTGMDNTLSDVARVPMSVFAVGLGGCTDPTFLTKLCRGGFWKHVSDAYYPQDAFEVAFGTILASVDLYTVKMNVSVERDGGAVVEGSEIEFSKYIGLLTKDSCRARKLKMPVPVQAKPGDELVIKTSFGIDGGATESRIFMADSVEYTSGIYSKTTSNMIAGLFAEAEDIERAIEKLRAKISLGETVRSSTDELIQENSRSSAVRSQLERYSTILENSLSAASAGSSIGTASMSFYQPHMSFVPYAPYAPHAPVSVGYPQPVVPSYSHHEVTSSFSQIES
jgi:hypothetical protein